MFDLTNPAWGGIDAIAGIIGLLISVLAIVAGFWSARKPQARSRALHTGWRMAALVLSFVLPLYAVFAFPIIVINAFTDDPRILLYVSVALASVLGAIWGMVWATYILKAFSLSADPQEPRDV